MKNRNEFNDKGEFNGIIISESTEAYKLNILSNHIDIWIPKSWIRIQTLTGTRHSGTQIINFKLHYWAIPKLNTKLSNKLSKIWHRKSQSSTPGFIIPTEEEIKPIQQRREESRNIIINSETKECIECKKLFDYYIGYEYGNKCSLECYKLYLKR